MSLAKDVSCMGDAHATRISVQLTSDGKLPYDPTTTGFAHITFYNAILGRLVRLNQNLTVMPSLLEEAYWDFKDEQYILKIRNGLKFHNGRPVVIEDLEFSLARFFFSTKRVDQVAFLRHIDGAEAIVAGTKYNPWLIKGLKRIDGSTMAVKLSSPNPSFLYSLAEGWVSFVPKEALQDDLVTWKTNPVGAGTYKVTSIKSNNEVEVCKVSIGAPGPEKVLFKSPKEADADVIGFVQMDPATTPLAKMYGTGPIGFTGLFFNSNNELGADLHFRKALMVGVDRESLVKDNPDYSPLSETLTSNFYGRLIKPVQVNVAVARAELAKVPPELLKGKIKAHWFTGRSALTGIDKKIVDNLKSQLKVLGLEVDFGQSNHPTFAEDDSATVLRIDDRGTAFPDPLIIFRAFEKPAFLSPFFPKDNLELKGLLQKAAKAPSLDVKAKAILELSEYFDKRSIVVPLYERKTVYWVNKDKISELGIQTGITFDLERLKIRGKL